MNVNTSYNSSSILGVDRRLRLFLEFIPGTTQEVSYTKKDYVSQVKHLQGSTVIRTDEYTYNEGSTVEKRTLNSGDEPKLTITHTIASGETTYVLS